jgi:CheY-like chemotaxis protein
MATILIIDDRADNCEYLRIVLTAAGYTVATACDGIDGLAKARTLRPALVLTDISMPGLNGYQLAEALHADPTLAGMPIVFSTAMSPDDKVEQVAASFGVFYVVHLPASVDRVLNVVAAALQGRPAPARPDLPSIAERLEELVQDLKNTQPKS